MKYAAGPSSVTARSVPRSVAHRLCMPLTKSTQRLSFPKQGFMKKLLGFCCMRVEMALIRTWSRQHHREGLAVDCPAPLMRRRSVLASHVSVPTSRIINLSGYNQALHACEAPSGQMSEIRLEPSSCHAPCNMMSCVYLWLSDFCELSWMCMTMGEWLSMRHLWVITKWLFHGQIL